MLDPILSLQKFLIENGTHTKPENFMINIIKIGWTTPTQGETNKIYYSESCIGKMWNKE